MELEELEKRFSKLSEITDRVSLLNSPYESNLDQAFQDLEEHAKDVMSSDLKGMDPEAVRHFLSHISFHREIISDIIDEARQLLMEDRREYLKRLVSYHKQLVKWVAIAERANPV